MFNKNIAKVEKLMVEDTQELNIIGFATQGSNGDDENRLRTLLSKLPVSYYPFRKDKKYKNYSNIVRLLLSERPSLIVMEGTGVFGGLALITGSVITKTPYIVSSGDSVGPFIASKYPVIGPLFNLYEKMLYKRATGFIGWTPYLTGRALTYGSNFGMTAAGWAPFHISNNDKYSARNDIRKKYGIPQTHIVVGIVGSLNWNKRIGYSYGLELIQANNRVERQDVTVMVVGDGTGRIELEKLNNKQNVIFTGKVPREEVPLYLSAMDAASLPQSVDQVGSFRYTTKVSEYLSVGLPIITGTIPMVYDLDSRWFCKIIGANPWSERYAEGLAQFITNTSQEELKKISDEIPEEISYFNKNMQIKSVTEFVNDIMISI
ncbi:glycosyltransferase [Paenibacillus daejeonensis]|uniref:glycosyltransferase n=1 Tax=Paenibacillus daejeonensis TaxID=135193 RepID=UPI000365E44E|nr:glycosyltransferase [Paenibacillus daejeonensis]